MSDIYVKWKKTDNIAGNISKYKTQLQSYASRVENVRNSLQLSSNVSSIIKTKLNKDIEQLNNLSQSLGEYSQSLKEISAMYQNVEKSMLES